MFLFLFFFLGGGRVEPAAPPPAAPLAAAQAAARRQGWARGRPASARLAVLGAVAVTEPHHGGGVQVDDVGELVEASRGQ